MKCNFPALLVGCLWILTGCQPSTPSQGNRQSLAPGKPKDEQPFQATRKSSGPPAASVVENGGKPAKELKVKEALLPAKNPLPVQPDDEIISEDENFFALPTVAAAPKVMVEPTKASEPIRLLGFFREERENAEVVQAILKVGSKNYLAVIGDEIEGAQILDIDSRSVTFQKDRERWTLTLHDQPVVNQEPIRPAPTAAAPSRSVRPRRETRPVSIPSPTLPPNNAVGQPPAASLVPTMTLPELPKLPDLSNLPGMGSGPGR